MENPLVSIILPIFNVEKYLNRCLNSIINQTYKNIEIILVDDLSTDSSGKICDDFSLQDTRIKVIHKKENQGLGEARNTGLKAAQGEFVFFIDSDDFVSINLVSECIKTYKKTNCDIVQYGHFNFKDDKVISKSIPVEKEYKKEQVIDFLIQSLHPTVQDCISCSAWSKMYSMNFLKTNNFWFVSEREYISEDVFSHILLIPHARIIASISQALYYYCFNSSSLTRTFRKDRLEKNNYQLMKEIQLIKGQKYETKIINQLYLAYYSNILGALKNITTSNLPKSVKTSEIKKILTNQTFFEVNKQIDVKKTSLNVKILNYCIKHKMFSFASNLIRLKYKIKSTPNNN